LEDDSSVKKRRKKDRLFYGSKGVINEAGRAGILPAERRKEIMITGSGRRKDEMIPIGETSPNIRERGSVVAEDFWWH